MTGCAIHYYEIENSRAFSFVQKYSPLPFFATYWPIDAYHKRTLRLYVGMGALEHVRDLFETFKMTPLLVGPAEPEEWRVGQLTGEVCYSFRDICETLFETLQVLHPPKLHVQESEIEEKAIQSFEGQVHCMETHKYRLGRLKPFRFWMMSSTLLGEKMLMEGLGKIFQNFQEDWYRKVYNNHGSKLSFSSLCLEKALSPHQITSDARVRTIMAHLFKGASETQKKEMLLELLQFVSKETELRPEFFKDAERKMLENR